MGPASTGANAGSEVIIADLGLGNLRSVERALERAGGISRASSDPEEVRAAARLVVPGQGSFRDGAAAIASPLGGAIADFLDSGRPYLGICLGMQLLFERSEEASGAKGLGFFRGDVVRFPDPSPAASGDHLRLKVPHMGWNQVSSQHPQLEDEAWYYFVHSYHCVPDNEEIVAGTTDYGRSVCAAVSRGTVFACQFHPEKSHQEGLRLLQKFMEARCD